MSSISAGNWEQVRVQSGPRPRQEGDIVALVGTHQQGRVSSNGRTEQLERLVGVDNDLLGYNVGGGRVLVRYAKNERSFDQYLEMAFTKGVTERETGRTLLILGSDAHHGEAMQGQFAGTHWGHGLEEEVKNYGNTVRWLNVGDTKQGFVGLDYNPAAEKSAGVATTLEEVKYLATVLVQYGFEPKKRLYLLNPPYIQEQEIGKTLRQNGFLTLQDFINKKLPEGTTFRGGKK